MAFRAELDDFGAFYERTYPAAYRTAWAILRNQAAATDAVQDAYLDAYLARGRLRGDAPARSWLLRIVVNRVFAELRRARPHQLEIDLEGGPAAPGDDLARATDHVSLDAAMRVPTHAPGQRSCCATTTTWITPTSPRSWGPTPTTWGSSSTARWNGSSERWAARTT
jgi:RNA polymerase sigma factor (sigma-70 family)